VGFVAFNSHATYPMMSKEIVFQKLEADFFVDLQGVVAVDRTLYYDNEDGNFRYLEPVQDNGLRVKSQQEIELGISDLSEYWQEFAGTWGSTALLPNQNDTPRCFKSNQTCPTQEENPVFYLILQVLGIKSGGGLLVAAASLLVDSVNGVYLDTGKSPRGPPAELSYSRWEAARIAPLWSDISSNTTAEDYCDSLVEVTDFTKLSPDVDQVPLSQHLLYLIYFCVAMMMANIVCYSLNEYYEKPASPLFF